VPEYLRHAAAGHRSEIVRYGRMLINETATLDALLAGRGEANRHCGH
jgi:hypothetical protein